MVGGRSYNQSQFNRAVSANRQPGSVFKPFVYLAAFERAADDGVTTLTPATLVNDEPTTFDAGRHAVEPVELRERIRRRDHAAARAGHVAQRRHGEGGGSRPVTIAWPTCGNASAPARARSRSRRLRSACSRPRRSDIATAYTIFPNNGARREPAAAAEDHARRRRRADRRTPRQDRSRAPDTTYLVTNMMRSVINEGTGAGVRASGFALDAAGKTGTTNDLRDAWFVGFTPELLTVVWVGLDENQALGLSGAQAALPIWTTS